MKILLIHRYFSPDTPPYAAMLRSIAGDLASSGHDVTVFSSQPSYKSDFSLKRQPAKELLDGMTVYRVSLFRERGRNILFRLINMFYFPFRILIFTFFHKKFDIIMASTAPPVVVGFSAAISSKLTGARFFYHCMDIHPEIGKISGEFSNPVIFKILRFLDSISCAIANRIIVLSQDMKKSLLSRPKSDRYKIDIINNFSLPHFDTEGYIDSGLIKASGKFRVIFAGNIGRFQGLDSFVLAMSYLKHQPMIELVFIGEGSALASLKSVANNAENIKFIPHQSVNNARKLIADADLGVVSLNKDIFRYAYPSKTMTYLDEGCPLLVSVEKESELINFLEQENIGLWVEPGNEKLIAGAIESIYLNRNKQEQMKVAAKNVSINVFSKDIAMKTWHRIFTNIDGAK